MRLAGLRRFGRATSGAVAVEFAFVGPILLTLLFGGYTVAQCVAVSRKVTLTTRATADLTTQFATMSATDMSNVLNASTQIMAPYQTTGLSLRLSEITTDSTGLIPHVTWSVATNALTGYATGSTITLPSSMLIPNTSYIFSETQYSYTPLTALGTASISLGDHIYMLPRLSSNVAYSG